MARGQEAPPKANCRIPRPCAKPPGPHTQHEEPRDALHRVPDPPPSGTQVPSFQLLRRYQGQSGAVRPAAHDKPKDKPGDEKFAYADSRIPVYITNDRGTRSVRQHRADCLHVPELTDYPSCIAGLQLKDKEHLFVGLQGGDILSYTYGIAVGRAGAGRPPQREGGRWSEGGEPFAEGVWSGPVCPAVLGSARRRIPHGPQAKGSGLVGDLAATRGPAGLPIKGGGGCSASRGLC